MPRRKHAREQVVGQRFTGLPVSREQRKRLALPGEVFHNWFGSSTASIPRRRRRDDFIDLGQQMMQAVTEL
jgi:hypothetical protein